MCPTREDLLGGCGGGIEVSELPVALLEEVFDDDVGFVVFEVAAELWDRSPLINGLGMYVAVYM